MQLVIDPGKAIGLNCLGLDGFEWRSLPNLPKHHAYVIVEYLGHRALCGVIFLARRSSLRCSGVVGVIAAMWD